MCHNSLTLSVATVVRMSLLLIHLRSPPAGVPPASAFRPLLSAFRPPPQVVLPPVVVLPPGWQSARVLSPGPVVVPPPPQAGRDSTRFDFQLRSLKSREAATRGPNFPRREGCDR